ncbi:MAG: DUF2309 domain-containing protein [Myxococcota bacterium]
MLRTVVDGVAHLLPGQGPINVFIHHNTLHAFEDRVFEDAVVEAGRLFGCQPYLGEASYRAEIGRGRITEGDVRSVLAEQLGSEARHEVAGLVDRLELRLRIALHGLEEVREPMLSWLLGEERRNERLRPDLPADARAALSKAFEGSTHAREAGDPGVARALWDASLAAARRSRPGEPPAPARPPRHRDLLRDATGHDIDDWVNPLLIRFLGAFLDQGMAHWELAGRERGIYRVFAETFRDGPGIAGRAYRELARLLRDDAAAKRGAAGSLEHSLRSLGVDRDEWYDYLSADALALRGFAGMVRQMETRPDRMPVRSVPASLQDYLAVRALCERAALAAVLPRLGFPGDLAGLRDRLRPAAGAHSPAPSLEERAWRIFQAAQLLGVGPDRLLDLADAEVEELEREIAAFDETARRELLHRAFERRLRVRLLDALAQHQAWTPESPPAFQAVFCLDEREESFRRHLEEVEPRAETFGAAGFFGVAMYYRGATDARPRPLCPPAIQPHHSVTELRTSDGSPLARLESVIERAVGLANKNLHVGSRTLARGAVLMSLLGTLSLVPLVLRVLAPGLGRRLGRFARPLRAPVRSEITVHRDASASGEPVKSGFDTDEMAQIVADQLLNMGIGSPARLVFVVAHGSVSLNNPHESAHDCGACGGGAGGPNARAFARMANDPAVRERLAERGLPIPESSWFVGAQRNTASNEVVFFDEDRVPGSHREDLARARAAFEIARESEALERCRRFDGLSPSMSSRAALRHVEARASDLAQPRPEYGHASNAFCVIGRRSRTRGLFLDRRAFLVSYDPSRDGDGAILGNVLGAVVPVVAGINLEYYFSTVDPTGYGSGTKLPHNVTGLLGVMDGAQSDLRTGLPWQMVEIHEPVRLTIVVECPPARLGSALDRLPDVDRLCRNRWLHFACLDPASNDVFERVGDRFERHRVEGPLAGIDGPSSRWFLGRSGHLPIARIRPAGEGGQP